MAYRSGGRTKVYRQVGFSVLAVIAALLMVSTSAASTPLTTEPGKPLVGNLTQVRPVQPAFADAADLVSEQPLRTWRVRDLNPAEESAFPDWDVLVWDFAELNGVMYVGGRFQTVQKYSGATEHSQPFLAAFDVATGQWISTFRPTLDAPVYALAPSPDGSRLLVGGEFSNVNGAPLTSAFAALDPFTGAPDPTWTASFTREEGPVLVKDIEIYGNDVYVGGRFSHVESHVPNSRTRRYSIARLDGTAGTLDQAWNLAVNGGKVMSLAVSPDGTEIFAGGFFTAMGQLEGTKWMAKASTVDATVTPMPTPPPADGKYYVFEVEVTDDKVFAATEWHRLFVWDRATLALTNNHWSAGYGGDYQALHQVGDVVWSGGHFHGFDEDQAALALRDQVQWLAPYDAQTGDIIPGWVARLGMKDGVFAITEDSEGKLWVGGDPTSAGTIPVGGFAVFPTRAADVDVNLARDKPATQSSNGVLGALFRGRTSESRCNNATNPTFLGVASNANDGKTAGGPWECSIATTQSELTPWWQVDLEAVGQVDMVRIWNMYSTDAKADLADVWIAVSDDAAAINSTDPVALAADPNVTLVQMTGVVGFFGEVPVGAYGQHVRVFLDPGAPVQLRLPEVEILDLDGVEPPPPGGNNNVLVAEGSTWRYLDDGAAPAANWNSASFDDASWAEGPALLGFGDADIATTTAAGSIATYLRHTFEVEDPAAVPGLELGLLVDDGGVAYLNGQELHRVRMPVGPVTESTPSAETVWGAAERTWTTVEVPSSAIVAGTNVLAVEVHNNWTGGNDLAADATLKISEDVIVPPIVDQILVGLDQSWSYLDDGVDPGAGWADQGFDDGAWAVGPAQLGYGDNDEATIIEAGPAPNRHITSWFRTEFTVANPAEIGALQIGLIRDDGAAVYVNGVEVVRDNLPAGPLTSSTLASNYAWGPGETNPHTFTVPADALVAGSNVVAVEVHSADQGSKDFSFALELIGKAP